MTKRKFTERIEPSEEFNELFKPIFNAKKMYGAGKELSQDTARGNPLVQALIGGYDELEKGRSPLQRELANFIIHNTMRSGHRHGEVQHINLIPGKPRSYSSLPAGLYNSDARIISLRPEFQDVNPIMTLTHEGTHALDHLLMRTYQDQAISYLASQEGLSGFNLPGILEGAQRILPQESSFLMAYPPSVFQRDIGKAYRTLSDSSKPAIRSFSEAHARLQAIRERGDVPHHAPFFSFSEFPAHAMEYLHKPWQIDLQTNPQSAAFMHGILGDVQGHFQRLGLQPSIMRGFQERLQQLKTAAERGSATSIGRPAAAGPAAAAAGPQPAPAPSAAAGPQPAPAPSAAAVPPAPVPAAAAPGIPAAPPATTIGKPAGTGLY